MTAITLTTLPIIIGAGTIFGHFLRVISRLAQSQSAVSSSVAEEAFSNIRTVRSFAMEYSETTYGINFLTYVRYCYRISYFFSVSITTK